MNTAAKTAISWTEQGLVPDSVIRHGIRRLLRQRLGEVHADDPQAAKAHLNDFVRQMDLSPVALVPEKANEQHYEVPAAFFAEVLGPRNKYSGCYWPDGTSTLGEAEKAALARSCDMADIRDGMDILDLGCGWGSMSLWLAEHYPAANITAVSNSTPQRKWIEARAAEQGLRNVRVQTHDMNDFETERRFDRIVSIEMFEHMRNYRELFARISRWLVPDGRFYMHIFCHRLCTYEFEDRGPSDWMGRHFFSGGIMPSADLPLRFQGDLLLEDQHLWSGQHYARTAEAWLKRMDQRKDRVLPILEQTYGQSNADQWMMRWRMFFMACAELFAYDSGREWMIGHYVFRNNRTADKSDSAAVTTSNGGARNA